jgi:hypothetical protein
VQRVHTASICQSSVARLFFLGYSYDAPFISTLFDIAICDLNKCPSLHPISFDENFFTSRSNASFYPFFLVPYPSIPLSVLEIIQDGELHRYNLLKLVLPLSFANICGLVDEVCFFDTVC